MKLIETCSGSGTPVTPTWRKVVMGRMAYTLACPVTGCTYEHREVGRPEVPINEAVPFHGPTTAPTRAARLAKAEARASRYLR